VESAIFLRKNLLGEKVMTPVQNDTAAIRSNSRTRTAQKLTYSAAVKSEITFFTSCDFKIYIQKFQLQLF
jgi:hypothetical protein